MAQAEYKEANKQVKKSIRADKQRYVEELATTAEKLQEKEISDNNMTEKYSKTERLVKDKEGKTITGNQERRNRCVEYFKELLNRPAPLNPPDIEVALTDLPIDVSSPTIEEIRMIGYQTNQGWESGRTKARYTNNCKYTPHSIQEDLGERTSSDGLERKTPHQDAKERRYEQT
ncbi:unnamed protein product [Schistosoma curassoni]|uniref:DUF3421 domain-containing protein n=1 Tax=Schistosoma curassoni TaxID=6186 RepID=A0A183KV16_9TREM|nr:unnamed protein product [Schistosoma curassoni]